VIDALITQSKILKLYINIEKMDIAKAAYILFAKLDFYKY